MKFDMGWSIGYDYKWQRDIGYGVPAVCDSPKCKKQIDRGLAYVCGSDVHGGEYGCGLFFCSEHSHSRHPRGSEGYVRNCKRCLTYQAPYKAKPDVLEWLQWKLSDQSWAEWRHDHQADVADMHAQVARLKAIELMLPKQTV